MKFTNALGGCANCGALTSPCWRKGPEEARHLCNACGSRYLVKGTLEGYKPGLKSRTGGKRPKSKSKPCCRNGYSAHRSSHSEPPQKRIRLFKENGVNGHRSLVDKAIQVNLRELQGMPAFARTISMDDGSHEAYIPSSSHRYHYSAMKQELGHGFQSVALGALSHPEKYSSDESSPEAELITPCGKSNERRRARKPCRPTVSTW